MKRDMDLVRKILLAIEAADYAPGRLSDPDFPDDAIAYHVLLLAEAGLLIAADLTTRKGPDAQPIRLTWAGHEFLETARNDTYWKDAKAAAASVGGMAFDVVKSILVELATRGAKHVLFGDAGP